jgi:phosphatidylglycerol lysyltransferase
MCLALPRAHRRALSTTAPPIDARVSRTASIALRFGLLTLATWALRRELVDVRLGEVMRQFGGYGWRHAALALAGTLASFATLGLIELLAVRYAGGTRVPRRTAMTTAFVAHAFSQSVGLALLTGAAVRLRAYARRGLDAAAVARISGFVTLTITLGLLACGAGALLASRTPLHVAGVALPGRVLGAVLAVVVLAYLGWSSVASRDHIGRGRWLLRRPSARVAVGQVVLSSADWLLTGTVLFALLPAPAAIGYGSLLGAYLVAQTLAMASHVPGGAGVLEALMLTLTISGSAAQRSALIAALLMFRIVYYLAPLAGALVVAGVAELRPRRAARVSAEPMALDVR